MSCRRRKLEHSTVQIGDVAKTTGVSTKMIRHYESIGLIASGPRRINGYRDYGARDVHELRFIRSSRDLGFSLDNIRALLDLWRDKGRHSRDVHALAATHLGVIEMRISELSAIALSLRALLAACHGDDRPDCPILDDLGAHAGPKVKHAFAD
jgi:Cu(I)-responsive transcriptional regulator